jgi:ABC-type uncharacterized transport system ATPase component
MITHNVAHALEIGDSAVLMNRGRIFKDLPREDLAKMTAHHLMELSWEGRRQTAVARP